MSTAEKGGGAYFREDTVHVAIGGTNSSVFGMLISMPISIKGLLATKATIYRVSMFIFKCRQEVRSSIK